MPKKNLIPYKKDHLQNFIRRRAGEQKLGEMVTSPTANWEKSLHSENLKFVIVGIAEDMGVRANFGRPGAYSAFEPALSAFLNMQNNSFLNGDKLMVLGEIFVEDLMEKSSALDVRNAKELTFLRELVAQLDERVAFVIEKIVSAGKIPLVIGGGHNNAYGNIAGASAALKRKINVINCDAHLDFRSMEGRHSGNGFRFAYENSYLDRYAVLCMHEQYNNRHVTEKFVQDPSRLFFETFESVFVREEKSFDTALRNCAGFVSMAPCGIEFDLDAVSNIPSSARTSSGVDAVMARQYMHKCAALLDCVYLHIAEAAPVLSHIRTDFKTGKLIAYMLSDFIKSHNGRHQLFSD